MTIAASGREHRDVADADVFSWNELPELLSAEDLFEAAAPPTEPENGCEVSASVQHPSWAAVSVIDARGDEDEDDEDEKDDEFEDDDEDDFEDDEEDDEEDDDEDWEDEDEEEDEEEDDDED